jgi:hypothetical protein
MCGDSIDFGVFFSIKFIKKRQQNQAAPLACENLSLGKKVLDKAKKNGYIGAVFHSQKTRKPAPDKGFRYIECTGPTKHNSTNSARHYFVSRTHIRTLKPLKPCNKPKEVPCKRVAFWSLMTKFT